MTTASRRIAVVLLAVMTTACGLTNTGDPSTAAVVDGRRIAAADVDEVVDGVRASQAFRQAQGDLDQLTLQTQTQLVNAFVLSAVLEQVARRNGVTVSDEQVAQVRDQIAEQAGGEEALDQALADQGVPSSLIDQQARDTALQNALSEQLPEGTDLATFVRGELDDVDIEVNPRYGAWDTSALAVEPVDPLAPQRGAASPEPAPAPGG